MDVDIKHFRSIYKKMAEAYEAAYQSDQGRIIMQTPDGDRVLTLLEARLMLDALEWSIKQQEQAGTETSPGQ